MASDVSRETREELDHYLYLLRKWSPKINLVSPESLEDAEQRHMQDSLQILDHAPLSTGIWADLGSGAGFPGLVVAIALKRQSPDVRVHLVESDQRKATFLRTVSRETNTPVVIHPTRIETLPELAADVVSARALASLPKLLPLVYRHLQEDGVAVLPKGKDSTKELAEAKQAWDFDCVSLPSKTHRKAVILKIGALRHV